MMELTINKEFRDLIPALSADEYQGLERSILKEGIREPILVWNGTLVDGHNRYSVAKRHDVDFKTSKMQFESECDVKIWILSNQLSRRNITPFVKAEMQLDLENMHRVRLKAKKDAVAPSLDGVDSPLPDISKDTREEIAKAAGVSHGYIHTVSRIQKSGRVDDDTMRKLRKNEITAGKVLKAIKKEERLEKASELMDEAALNYKPAASLQIVHADFYQWCNENLEDSSVDMILTDPPYPKEYLHVWEQLSEVADRVLKFGGYLVTYSGQMYLDYVMQALGTHLSYVWTVALHHTGPTQYVNPRGLVCGWKPILIYKKGPAGKLDRYSGVSLMDFIGNDYREKNFHEWGQGESAVGYLMKTLSQPGDMILDPFVGGGTTLAVAKELKRKCIGIEIDKKYINTIKANIMKDDQKEIV
jgi:hypothetical protein